MTTKEITIPKSLGLYAKDEPYADILPLENWFRLHNDLDDNMSVADAIKAIGLHLVVKVTVEVKE